MSAKNLEGRILRKVMFEGVDQGRAGKGNYEARTPAQLNCFSRALQCTDYRFKLELVAYLNSCN